MPIIRFTEADKLASTIIETNWYKAEIAKIDGPQASSSGKSVNFYVDFRIKDGKLAGKELEAVFNTGMSEPSVLGTRQFFPHTMFIDIACAQRNCSRTEIENDLDTDTLLGKPFDMKVVKGISQTGIPINTITQFVPPGAGKDAQVPF